MTFIYPYKAGSSSVKSLKEGLDAKTIKLANSKFKGKGKLVINWGNSTMNKELEEAIVINKPDAVKVASNKQTFFETVEGKVNIPPFTADKDVAYEWLKEGGSIIVREVLTGHSGNGIVYIDSLDLWEEYNHDNAKMYVKYIPKKDEYRVHVMFGEVVDVQRKAAKKDFVGEPNWKVRNHKNGFVFVREGVDPDDEVLNQAKLAVKEVGLDFGAVDIIWNNHYKKAVVLEINTAPGLEGTTLKNYINGLTEIANSFKKVSKIKNYNKNVTAQMVLDDYLAENQINNIVPQWFNNEDAVEEDDDYEVEEYGEDEDDF